MVRSVTSHQSPVTPLSRGALALLALFLAFLPQGAAAQSPLPVVVDADQIVYDDIARTIEATGRVKLVYQSVTIQADFARVALQDERIFARGSVVIVDAAGREMRGSELTYSARDQTVELVSAEAVIDGVYIKSDRLRSSPGRIVAGASELSSCDPSHLAYRITASSIEVTPGDYAVVHDATLWIGRYRILGLPSLIVALRSRRETAGSFPGGGYSNIDGLFVAYRFAFFVGAPLAYVSTSLGTLAQRAEVGVKLLERPLGFLPLSLTASASAGWHREAGVNVETTRLQYVVGLETPAIKFGPQTDWQTGWNWTGATYGTNIFDPSGDRQSILRLNSTITHRLAPDATLTLGYNVLRVYGVTPLAVDAIDPEDLIDEVRLGYQKTGMRGDEIGTTFKMGAFYDYRPDPVFSITNTTSIYAAYGERVSRRYHWEAGTEYNLDTQVVTLLTDTGIALGTDTYFAVQTRYNTTTTLFEELDYIVTAQILDCFELMVKYRQARQQLTIGIGLSTLQ